jgi:phage tail-like protein
VSIGKRIDPYGNFRFHVQLNSLIVAGFSTVRGIEMQMEPEEYSEGGVNTHSHKLPTRFNYSNLQLERGVTDSRQLWDWVQQTRAGQVSRNDVQVFLYGSRTQAVKGWEFRNAYPIRWAGPELQADQSAVAIETLELAHDGVQDIPIRR